MKFSNDPFHAFPMREDYIEKHLQVDTPLSSLPTIPEFFNGKEIFITGGTGFIGKVLIEKLLRSSPDIKAIYLLMREKKGQKIEDRLMAIAKLNLFDILRIKDPEFLKKIIPVQGDVSELNLGLSDSSRDLMKDVSIIFHSAASVRFDDSLKYAVTMNTRGTREIMKFAETLLNIKVVMHVSTTYSNVYLSTVNEEIYPPIADWKKTVEICEKYDGDTLNFITQHYTNFMPNTYVFSKNLAEHVTEDYKDILPVILFRPSIVMSACDEPFGGYVRFNFNVNLIELLKSLG